MVNTFITSSNIYETMENLDYRRLGKQRLEAKQLINILDGNLSGAWSKHPALLSFVGHSNALKSYYNICVQEWENRGYKNTMKLYDVDESKFEALTCDFDGITATFSKESEYTYPKFVSFQPYLDAHKASLLRKDPNFYSFDVKEEYLDNGYLWPCKYGDEIYENWDMKYLSPIGEGAPIHYRISKEDVELWKLNKNLNPKTQRKIKESGKMYQDYRKAEIYWDEK